MKTLAAIFFQMEELVRVAVEVGNYHDKIPTIFQVENYTL